MMLDELNTKMSEMFMSSQLESIGWSELSDSDKQAALNNANDEFNRLQWIGTKADPEQADAWPRMIYGELVEMPEPVKLGLCRCVFDFTRIETNMRTELIRSGVTSVKLGNLSETYDTNLYEKYRVNYKKYVADWIYRGVR